MKQLPFLAIALLLASCAQVEYPTGELAQYPVLLSDLLRFLAFALLDLLLLAQFFIPKLRRYYAAGATKCPQQLAAFVSRMLFLFGLSLLPLSMALGSEAFFPEPGHFYTPFDKFFMASLVPFLLMPPGGAVLGVIALLSMRRAPSGPELPPVARPRATRLVLLAAFVAMLLAQWQLVNNYRRPPLDHLCRVAMSDFHFNEPDGTINAEARALAHGYAETRDARACSPTHRITPLHLAAATQETELVQQLLRDGADPNARMLSRPEGKTTLAPGDTPLTLALRREATNERGLGMDGVLEVVDSLLRSGADARVAGHGGSTPLALCAESFRFERGIDDETGGPAPSGEDIALRLLAAGAVGSQAEGGLFVRNGWDRALARLLELGMVEFPGKLLRQCGAVFWHKGRNASGMPGARACANRLMDYAPAAAKAEVLARLCRFEQEEGYQPQSEGAREETAAFIGQLLARKVNPLHPAGEHGCSCAADYLAADADMCRRLAAMGIAPPEVPAHNLQPDMLLMQLQDIPAMAFSEEEARANFGLLQSLLSLPTKAQLGAPESYHIACARALALMLRADAARTRELAALLPLWAAEYWKPGAPPQARGLLYAAQQCKTPLLPAEAIVEHARAMLAAGRPMLAHAFIRLLEYDPKADDVIEGLCADDTPDALRAAAWCCKLHRAQLPAPGAREVERYFERRTGSGFSAKMVPELCLALDAEGSAFWVDDEAALSRPERLFYSGAVQTRHARYGSHRDALQKLGALQALALYMGSSRNEVAASLELEILLAQHIWQHRRLFLHPQGEASAKK